MPVAYIPAAKSHGIRFARRAQNRTCARTNCALLNLKIYSLCNFKEGLN
ncbi:hypothetical protein HMPREF0860_0231 [Treponema socranskii subsp. socranskii VPI DR56BR1116 = ATCC 35536]|uniref:Uncharacterized protein n=1 Tax=Treponema socranskii subsp. socranskii VPI DR56BR1116 = ATCC 35536 TaxID=1125725 RepID=U1GT44_TRESO|nr:hypothetical protein HMPREF1325_0259 [Treponema socranskii subsp. socranskii VPI DR56BR1116 = ATCC 35536]ERJ98597.1 hypothetical protein HMPREF0860_0231 [Treponema socranskii subsp. socranskii VPI DR56BR1116 = ATCC 35536]